MKHGGGQAFPRTGYAHPDSKMDAPERMGVMTEPQDGMTLRDYFAGRAVCAIVGVTYRDNLDSPKMHKDYSKTCAAIAYELADAMIAHRSKP